MSSKPLGDWPGVERNSVGTVGGLGNLFKRCHPLFQAAEMRVDHTEDEPDRLDLVRRPGGDLAPDHRVVQGRVASTRLPLVHLP